MADRVAAGISVDTILVVAALVLAVLALLGVYNPLFLMALAVIALCLTYFV